MQSTEQKTVTIQAEHKFGDTEMAALGRQMASKCQDRQRLEDQLASIKKDFGAKIQSVELEVDLAAQKLRDGFEMRNTPAYVIFNSPTPGRKSFYRERPDSLTAIPEDFIREEAMDATDFQRDLPLEEKHADEYSGPTACDHGVPLSDRCEECDALKPARGIPVDPERFPETGDSSKEVAEAREIIQEAGQAIGTSLADKLAQAAQGKRPNPVVIDFSGKDSAPKVIAKWRKAARNQGWPEACIDLIDGIAKTAAVDGKQAVLDVLNAHSITLEEFNRRNDPTGTDEHERLAGTFGTSEDGQ